MVCPTQETRNKLYRSKRECKFSILQFSKHSSKFLLNCKKRKLCEGEVGQHMWKLRKTSPQRPIFYCVMWRVAFSFFSRLSILQNEYFRALILQNDLLIEFILQNGQFNTRDVTIITKDKHPKSRNCRLFALRSALKLN